MARREDIDSMTKWLAALPVFNEASYVDDVLREVCKYADNVLVVNDGSTDGTTDRLRNWSQVSVIDHATNRGYGAALKTAFQYAIDEKYDFLVTLDCDGQHQPKRLPRFVAACHDADIVSGSRYLKRYAGDSEPPKQRMFINRRLTQQINDLLGLSLTDSFCGFKAYRVSALEQFDIQDDGYAMPLELWVQAAMLGLRIIEIPVPLIYLDLERSFGGALDDAEHRLMHYNECLQRSVTAMKDRGYELPFPPSPCRECPQ